MGCNTVSDYTVDDNDLSKTPIKQLGSKKNLFLLENLLIKFQPFFPDAGEGVDTPEDNFSGRLM